MTEGSVLTISVLIITCSNQKQCLLTTAMMGFLHIVVHQTGGAFLCDNAQALYHKSVGSTIHLRACMFQTFHGQLYKQLEKCSYVQSFYTISFTIHLSALPFQNGFLGDSPQTPLHYRVHHPFIISGSALPAHPSQAPHKGNHD